MWGIYCRANHPVGYGWSAPDGRSGGAHGYVLLAVDVGDEQPPCWLGGVPVGRLWDPTRSPNPGGVWWDTWYGGDFDLVASSAGPIALTDYRGDSTPETHALSIGDNRAAMMTTLARLREHGVRFAQHRS